MDNRQDLSALIEEVARGLPGQSPDERLHQMIGLLREHSNPNVREAAAYGMRNLELKTVRIPEAVPVLLEVLGNVAEEIRIRVEAAESVGEILAYQDRRRKTFRQAVRVLINVLSDPAPEVRFWSAFALGQMDAGAALNELRRVATTDEAMCPRWWLVRDEAADAIAHILGQPTPVRIPESMPRPESETS